MTWGDMKEDGGLALADKRTGGLEASQRDDREEKGVDTQRAIYVYRNGRHPEAGGMNNFRSRDAWRDEVR